MIDRLKRQRALVWKLIVVSQFWVSYVLYADSGKFNALKDNVAKIMGLLFLLAFPWGVITIWQGAVAKKKGDPEAYNSIVAGLIIAGAGLIMAAIYAAFNIGIAASDVPVTSF